MPFPAYRFPGLLQPQALPRMQGLLDGRVFGFNMPGGGLLQPAADILQFRRRQGLLGLEGEGAARPGGGPRIGSPEWTRAYEAQSGLRPGSMQPVERGVTRIDPASRTPVEISPELMAKRLSQPTAKQQGQLERNKASAVERYFGEYPNQPKPSHDSAVFQQKHMKEVEAAIKKLPPELVMKIDAFSNKTGATPYHRGNAIIDAANIKAARKAWESYTVESYMGGIMPPALQPPFKPPTFPKK